MKNHPTTDQEQMKRGEFLRSLGMSSAALMAFYCMGTSLTSCSKSSDPTPTTPTTGTTTGTGLTGNADASKGAINFTLDLTDANYSKLKTVGAFVKVGSVLVANAKGSKYVTIQRICTHQQLDLVSYRLASDDFYCDGHGSVFATNGSVVVAPGGPSQAAMTLYKSALSTDGNTLTVTA
ncbi:Rieske 2Fe-2S domain-containing protein [Spirosoma flavum]|uniref:Rieske 2Fe-2S domain-containing protein n=1 Tax=Spirosoma flavum TaxID=2048557 RepID=A0ABW6AAY7_9BACT